MIFNYIILFWLKNKLTIRIQKRKININNCLRSCLNFYFPFFLKTAKNIDLKFYLKKNIKREIKKENVLNFIIFMSKNYFNKSEEISIKFNPN